MPPRISRKTIGDAGERYVQENVPCPNCGKALQGLPESYPLYDVQCTSCLFRAQVKAPGRRPASRIRGAGWSILSGALRTGATVPPLIAAYSWVEAGEPRSEVRFYPFIPKDRLRPRALSKRPDHPRASYKMFDYERLHDLPHFTLEGSHWRPGQT